MSERSQAPIVISPQEYKSSQIAESKRQAAENQLDEGTEGGRYLVGDQMVDANGNPIKEKKTRAESPTGPTGATGATGATSPTGATGPTGANE